MSYCSQKNERYWIKMQQSWHEEIVAKQFWEDLYKYNFSTNDEWTIYDYEQSPLCQIIWGEILSDYLNTKHCASNEDRFVYLIHRRDLIITNNNERYRFLFDVMHNLKECWSLDKKNHYYHFIGNFTPIPANRSLKRSLQLIHRDYNEDWNKMIEHIHDNWDKYGMNNMTFDEYIQMTYQDDYYLQERFSEIKNIADIKAVFNKRGKKIQNRCMELLKK